MSKSLTMTIILCLLCFHNWSTAHAAAGPLDSIESRIIFENFPVETGIDIDTQSIESQSIRGCSQVKTFQVFEADVPGQIVVAMCEEGEFSPNNIEATLAKRIADAKESFKKMPAPFAQAILAGVDPVTVSLEDGKQGKALTLPTMEHGFALVPLAYAVTAKKDATIVVQAYLNPNAPRNLSKPITVLLQGIYKRLQQNKR